MDLQDSILLIHCSAQVSLCFTKLVPQSAALGLTLFQLSPQIFHSCSRLQLSLAQITALLQGET